MFENEKDWLRRQPGMQPWEKGCEQLEAQIGDWAGGYSTPICEETVTDDQEEYPEYASRLWRCWSHHWAQAVEQADGQQVVGEDVGNRIQSGQGYARGGKLGGDPLRDVVLAVAMTRKENRAAQQFEKDYFPFAKNISHRNHPRFRDDADDWWNEFLDYLAGYTKPAGKLQTFIGKSSLRNWLGIVLSNFLRRRPLPGGAEMHEFHEKTVAASDHFARRECIDLFRDVIESALAELQPNHRLTLALLYVDGLRGNQAAAILDVNPGQITRWKATALQRLRELTDKRALANKQGETFESCQEYFPEGQAEFSAVLKEALEALTPREEER